MGKGVKKEETIHFNSNTLPARADFTDISLY
jgi:hypothetical protein